MCASTSIVSYYYVALSLVHPILSSPPPASLFDQVLVVDVEDYTPAIVINNATLPVRSTEDQDAKSQSDLPLFDPKQIDTLRCVPQVCNAGKYFMPSKNFTLLASFPGSGNTWTRTIIYTDLGLFSDGFRGEMDSPFDGTFSKHSAIKTHFPYIDSAGGVDPKTTGVVVVLRSPFDAILAEFKRRYGTGAQHRSKVSNETLQTKFPRMFETSMVKWKAYVDFWVGDRKRTAFVSREHGATSYEYSLLVRGRWIPVLVLFYEDFVRHLVVTTHRLVSFIKLQMGKRMALSAWDALVCTLTKGKRLQTKEKRHHRADEYNVYRDDTNLVAELELVSKACKLWSPHWFNDVWGDCQLPLPQTQRELGPQNNWTQQFRPIRTICEEETTIVTEEND
ncbi:hypothetical protein BASA81_005502 [Batrachochytrium salamandrivorans]|nr:hypothetical protein BASA81_005502 [Batrachochytrium salamandrivorans]